MLAPVALPSSPCPRCWVARPPISTHLRRRRRSLPGLGRLRISKAALEHSPRSWPRSTRTYACTASIPATCAPRCTRRPSPARTSPTGPSRRRASRPLCPDRGPPPAAAPGPRIWPRSPVTRAARFVRAEAHEPPEGRGLRRDEVRSWWPAGERPLRARSRRRPRALPRARRPARGQHSATPRPRCSPAGRWPDDRGPPVDAGARRGARRRARCATSSSCAATAARLTAGARASGSRGGARRRCYRRIWATGGYGWPSSCPVRCSTTWKSTAGPSPTRICARNARSRTSRRPSPPCPGAPRCRARGALHSRAGHGARRGSRVRRSYRPPHRGVSLERGERPYPEWYRVPASTARLAAVTRAAGGCRRGGHHRRPGAGERRGRNGALASRGGWTGWW